MNKYFSLCARLIVLFLIIICAIAKAEPIKIVAAENFYGQVAEQIGGNGVQVTSILKNPQQDPHLFSSTPFTARAVAEANIIIYNGLDYDPWMNHLIRNNQTHGQSQINMGELLQKKTGENPHIWYDPNTMAVLAKTLHDQLQKLAPADQQQFDENLSRFEQDYQQLTRQMAAFRQQFANTPIIATEPVFNEMAKALGLKMLGIGFQLSIMNDTEPSVSDTKQFEDLLTQRQVKVLIYNNQTADPITERMKNLAKQAGIPIVGVTETEPAGKNYFTWMSQAIDDLTQALKNQQLHGPST